jgi:hypothetical protein
VKGGSPCGTLPTMATPRSWSPSPQTASVVTATAATGPALARMSASRGFRPARIRSGFSPFRTQNRKAIAAAPIASVIGFVAPMFAQRLSAISTSVWPPPGIPRTWRSWLAAIRMPEAVMKPAITGWLRKFAMKPSRNTPISTSMRPDRKASTMAAAAYSAVPCSARFPTAAAVISDTTATGPTASAREVPKIA